MRNVGFMPLFILKMRLQMSSMGILRHYHAYTIQGSYGNAGNYGIIL